MIDVSWGMATDVGLVRATNQDDAFAAPGLFVVADGMGGHAGGEEASALAIAAFARLAAARPASLADGAEGGGGDGTFDAGEVLGAIERANAAILAAANVSAARRGMGTTVVGLALVGDPAYWLVFNVGDSRLYRMGGNGLEQLTVDHSAVGELVAARAITPDEAATHPHRHMLTRALGSDPAPAADCWTFCPVPGETFLLCSDGLYRSVPHESLTALLASGADAATLIAAANAAGGTDNATAIVVRVAGAPADDSPYPRTGVEPADASTNPRTPDVATAGGGGA